MNKLIAPAKKALTQKYGYKNVSVKNGQGTAWGWVECSVSVPTPTKKCGREHMPFEICFTCREQERTIETEARELIYKAWKALSMTPYTYASDDGYGTSSACVLISVNYI